MKKISHYILIISFIIGLSTSVIQAQLNNLHGDDTESRMGLHSGNLFVTSFFNDGTFGGRVNQPPQVAGEWPPNSNHYYLVDGNIFVGSEVTDNDGILRHINSENKSVDVGGSVGDKCGDDNHWCTFLPLPGFADPNSDRIAMTQGSSEWPNSWPPYWPDKWDDPDDPGWRNDNIDNNPLKAAWNGYFGKNVFNADQESYFVADDYENKEFNFTPDTLDPERGGLGIRMYVRGFQWRKTPVQDALYNLFDLENMGTYQHSKIVFGYKIGNNLGETDNGSDAGDDQANFDRDLNFAYMWDDDNIGASGWGPDPVGYMGGAFLESPGNGFDGIDNDNDGESYPGPTISETIFNRGTLESSTQVVLIDYSTFERIGPMTFNAAFNLAQQGQYDFLSTEGDSLVIHFSSRDFKFWVGKTLQEDITAVTGEAITTGINLFDDNLNGTIDENRGVELEVGTGVINYLYLGNKYNDYLASNVGSNPLLDERRDDGIDNDGDWNPVTDDLGIDGLGPGAKDYPGPDTGEGDGIPTDGEPNFDKTDISESDMIGLTSFWLYDWSNVRQDDDEQIWGLLAPGRFGSSVTLPANVELIYGSGYFPLVPGRIERFSMAIICGEDLGDILRNVENVGTAYESNYNFAKAPDVPVVKAITGDNKVTLFWDSRAEDSDDPVTGKDFEGYKIYRSTDPNFQDLNEITDPRFGTELWRRPVAQFDLNNDIYGFSPNATEGAQFWLGEDSGLRHFWVDTTVQNGYTYYYAVTSYDHGSLNPDGVDSLFIDPTECARFVLISSSGDIDKGTNIVIVRPEAPVAGFIQASTNESGIISGPNNSAQGTVDFKVINPEQIKNNHTYKITFKDTSTGTGPNVLKSTGSFTLIDSTSGEVLLLDNPLTAEGLDGLPITDGFQLSFSGNPESLMLDSINSGWSRQGIPPFELTPFSYQDQRIDLVSDDFEVIFGEVGAATSEPYYRGNTLLPATPVNFMIMSKNTGNNVNFAFRERAGEDGIFDYDITRRRTDEIIFLTPDPQNPDSLIPSWQLSYVISANLIDTLTPGPGDVLTLNLSKPFLSNDTFTFTTLSASIDQETAKADMDRIKVVPNPYVVSNSWEPTSLLVGSRERQLHFIHLPAKCTIKIFNVRGQLVNTLEHDAPLNDGTEIWDMLSRDNLEISYGIYIYHIQADGVGEKIGKFVVIK